MSLSGQYLEELSRRYKKQVEEMQRSLERAMAAMSEESRKSEEREAKRIEDIAALKDEIAVLSESFESLLYDQNSWRSRFSTIIQHVLLVCLEIIVIILILSYCRRGDDFEEEERFQSDTSPKEIDATRRKSSETFGSHNANAKRTKKRRPSEIASHISGTYHQLMVDDRARETTRKERKKKRKKETTVGTRKAINIDAKREAIRYKNVLDVIPGGTTLPSRRASSIDPPRTNESRNLLGRRPESAPETTTDRWTVDQTGKTERIAPDSRKTSRIPSRKPERSPEDDSRTGGLSESNSSSTTVDRSADGSVTVERKNRDSRNSSFRSGIFKGAKLSSPSFMKTALNSRSKRKLSSNSGSNWDQLLGHSNDKSVPSNSAKPNTRTVDDNGNGNGNNRANGFMEESDDESRSSSTTPTSGKKEKRGTGLKKMVRKFF